MKRLFLLLLSLAVCASVSASVFGQRRGASGRGKREPRMARAIRAVLDAQVEAWNRGDIEGFMRGYARREDTTFVSGDALTRGWTVVLNRYRKNYDSREKMGTLTFSELEIKPVAGDAAIVLGRWQLKRSQDTPGGRFTLIFRRTPEGWRIVHDHTS